MFWFVTQPRPRASRPASALRPKYPASASASASRVLASASGVLASLTSLVNSVYFETPVGSGSNPMDRVGSDPASDGSGRIESRFNGSLCNVHI